MWTMQSPKDFWELGTLLSSSKPQRNGTGSHSLQLSTQHGFIWTILNTSRRNYPGVKQIIEFKNDSKCWNWVRDVFFLHPKNNILTSSSHSSLGSRLVHLLVITVPSISIVRILTRCQLVTVCHVNWVWPSQPKNTKSDNETKKLRTTPKNWINRIQSASSIVVFSQCLPPQDSCSRR